MRKVSKIATIVVFTLIIGGLGLFAYSFDEETERPLVELQISDGNKICPWLDQKDNTYYFFLPSYVELNDLSFSLSDDVVIYIDDKRILNGGALDDIVLNTRYLLTDESGKFKHYFVFSKSGNISTMYINTVTDSIKSVLGDKKHKELVRMTIIDKNGNIDTARTDAYIKGRGNSTWIDFQKKPFAIVFNKPESLLNMDPCSEWALLANAIDKSGIRNAIIFETARNVGLENTPEYQYVDLYINGEYYGLYMLCQTAETFMERAALDDEFFLFSPELLIRKNDTNHLVYVENNEAIVDVVYPKKLSSNDQIISESILRKLDDEIISGSDNIGEMIDIDSWVKKYLIDEIFENYDSGMTSSYFYSVSEGESVKVYAGPIWDYDNSMGIFEVTKNPETFFANQTNRSKDERILWYHELYTNEMFYDAMVNSFKKDYLPQLEILIEKEISDLAEKISISKANDDIRWGNDSVDDYKTIIEYLTKRMNFLKNVWIDNEEYIDVEYYNSTGDTAYHRLSVPKGAAISSMDCSQLGLDITENWYIEGTSELYDFDAPVVDKVVLVNISSDRISIIDMLIKDKDAQKIVFVVFSISVLPMLLFMLRFSIELKKGAVDD